MNEDFEWNSGDMKPSEYRDYLCAVKVDFSSTLFVEILTFDKEKNHWHNDTPIRDYYTHEVKYWAEVPQPPKNNK